MRSRDAVFTTLLAAALVTPSHARSPRDQPPPCDPPPGGTYHGELTQPIGSYTSDAFRAFATERNWLDDKGVDAAPRRADCGPGCLYKGKANERDDNPKDRVLVANHPICDANKISHLKLPPNGVLIGRLTHIGEQPQGTRRGDASFNVRRATPGLNPGRAAQHYVVIVPGRQFIDRSLYAIWKIVAILNDGRVPVAVVDSGLFRVCLPRHPMATDILASFRSCAEVSEFHDISMLRGAQVRVVGERADSAEAQRILFSMLVRADSTALSRITPFMDSILALPRGTLRREGEPDAEPTTHGPYVRAARELWGIRRVLDRYGELHIDAPLWYTCAEGCCSGEPW